MGFPIFNIPNFKNATRKRRVNPITGQVEDEENISKSSNPTSQGNNLLGNLLNSIASGFAVGLSDNPGATLMQQLSQQRQTQMQREQMQYEREQQKAQQDFQKQMKQQELEARRQEQQTEIGFKKEAQASEQRHDFLLTDKRFLLDKQRQKDHLEAETSLLKLKNEFDLVAAKNHAQYAQELEAARNTNDITQIEIKQIMGALLSATKYKEMVPTDKVLNIIDKRKKGIALTKEDISTIDIARRINILSTGGGGYGGNSGGIVRNPNGQSISRKLTEKNMFDLEQTRNDLIKEALTKPREVPVLNPDGSPKINPVNGQPLTITSNLSLEEAMELRDSFDKLTGYSPQGAIATKTAIAEPKLSAQSNLQALSNIRNAIINGATDEEIRGGAKMLSKEDQQQVEAMLKNRKSLGAAKKLFGR